MRRRTLFFSILILIGFVSALYFLLKKGKKPTPPSCWSFHLGPKTKPVRKSSLDVRIFFGYKDTRPARFVADRYESQLFTRAITSPCQEDRHDCGFQLDPAASREDLEIYMKDLVDPAGVKKRITLSVQSSSVGPDDDENRKNPFQKWKSQRTQESFTEALANADVIFYNGHSRAGGGPDFTPPKLLANKHIDYGWFQRKKPGLKTITDYLKGNPQSQLQVLGLFSCQSEQLFSKQIEKSKVGLKVMDSDVLLYFSDAINESLDALSNLQVLKCGS